jgi:hypothetical protein
VNTNQLADIEQVDAIEFSIDDTDNPRSVISLTSSNPTIHDAIKDLLLNAPELMEMEQHELSQRANPSFTLSRVRMSFWNEYENANQGNRKMHLSKIVAGVCTETVFRKKILGDRVKLAYVLCPPKDYQITVKEALDAGLDSLRAIVSARVIDENGNLNAKSADVVLKAIALLDMRVKGAVIQRIDQRSLNVNLNKEVPPGSLTAPDSLEDLERQLAAVKQKLVRDISQARLPAQPVDMVDTMKEIGAELVDVGGSYKLRGE